MAGARHLRSSLIQPSTDIDTISARLDCVSELLARPDCLQDVHKILPSLYDSDRLLKYFCSASKTSTGQSRAKACISAVLGLKASLGCAPLLADALTATGQCPPQNELLCAIVDNLSSPDLEALRAVIDEVVDADAVYDKKASVRTLNCLFTIKTGASQVCALVRSTPVSLATLGHPAGTGPTPE